MRPIDPKTLLSILKKAEEEMGTEEEKSEIIKVDSKIYRMMVRMARSGILNHVDNSSAIEFLVKRLADAEDLQMETWMGEGCAIKYTVDAKAGCAILRHDGQEYNITTKECMSYQVLSEYLDNIAKPIATTAKRAFILGVEDKHIDQLCIRGYGFWRITPEIVSFNKLRLLDLNNNQIVTIAGLEELKNLKSLLLSSNHIDYTLDFNRKTLSELEKNGVKVYK